MARPRDEKEPLEFLGCRIGRNYRRATGRSYIGTRRSPASVQSLCRRVSELTARRYGLTELDSARLEVRQDPAGSVIDS